MRGSTIAADPIAQRALAGEPTNHAERRHLRRLIERELKRSQPRVVAQHVTPAEQVSEGPVPHAVLRGDAQLRELWRQRGVAERDAGELIERGLAPVAGGATGRGAVAFAHNLPAEGSYVMDPTEFEKWTERNDMPLEQKALSGLGAAPIQQRISNVGVMSALRIVFTGSLVVAGAGTATALYRWPWGIISRYTLNLNGQTSLLSCEGGDLRARRQRVFRNPREEICTAPATDVTAAPAAGVVPVGNANPGVIANGTYNVTLIYDVPVAHDVLTLVGSIYAQSDQVYLQQQINPAASGELFTLAGGSTATLTGTFSTTLTFYDIPVSAVQGKGNMILLPDLRWLHGYFSADQPFANTGDVTFPLIRSAGQLISFALYLDNGGAAFIDPLALNSYQFQYGGNRVPRAYSPASVGMEKNQADYSGTIKPGARYAVLDFEADAPARDLVYPKGVTELGVKVNIPTGTTLNANAHGHFVEETLFSGV